MSQFNLVTLNLEHGCRNCDCGTLKGILLTQSHPDVIFIQESAPQRLHLGSGYHLLDYSTFNQSTSNIDLIEPMDIYVKEDSSWKVIQQFQIDNLPQKSPRQSKIVVLQHEKKKIKITLANIHLIGGRYDENDQLGGFLKSDVSTIHQLKSELLQELVQKYQVDIIAGDFNSDLNCYLSQGQVCSKQLSYFKQVSPGKSFQVYQQWNLAPFNYLHSQGYQLADCVYPDTKLVSTSIFGNRPDAIWFKPSKIQSHKHDLIDFLTPNLSDHQGLSWKCQVNH